MSEPVHRFRMAMARNLGGILTSQMAAALEAEIFGAAHKPPRPEDPPPQPADEPAHLDAVPS